MADALRLLLQAVETNNTIQGYTYNAHNRNLSSGGSSGGKCILLSLSMACSLHAISIFMGLCLPDFSGQEKHHWLP